MSANESVKDIFDKLSTRAQSDGAMQKLLDSISVLDGTDGVESEEASLKLPYSSMPKLSSRSWAGAK